MRDGLWASPVEDEVDDVARSATVLTIQELGRRLGDPRPRCSGPLRFLAPNRELLAASLREDE